jgi:acetyltransferase-like isoleucine patch superfamily enzyme
MLVAPVNVGKGAVTGAGTVVTSDIPSGGVAVGSPSRVVRKRKRKAKPRSKGGRAK